MSEIAGAYLVAFSSCIFAITAVIYCWQQKKIINKQQLTIQQLQQDIKAVGAGAIGVGQRLQQVETKLTKTIDQQEILEQRDAGQLSYTQANKLCAMGASVEEIMDACGLSKAEAELVALVHRPSPHSSGSGK
ncbi:DUF2802 domain-containing protein [Endozoicomonas sp. SM1973]|uniref:DUF2802 domain-containing protein n=1 Tax=Spartinivicinus marinus TaxID=2994442 RepID=A0A853I422_9GAMM|nr:DUF2802 domain-containing protein [Spartinivicinus marinus]MCX4028949.1 DUF2802 domain-containing protein [Spartinivicinus marinus]NYZ65468.1 DUF2802 domain-containing protein [Spartinivicinus marinus]